MRRPHRRLLDQFFLFHPEPWTDRDWRRTTGLPLQDVRFRASDGTNLFGWLTEPANPRAVLLWCHGNAGNMIHRLDNLALLHDAGFSVFLFDYRGYGLSEGRPSEDGLYRDAEAAYGHLIQRGVAPEQLLIFGRSLGAAVAGALASARRAAGLILESCFPSVEAVARHHYHGLPVHWLLSARFRLIDRVAAVRAPVLIIHGDHDELIPIELGRRVFEAANAPKSFYVIGRAGHNDTVTVGGRAYIQRLIDFAGTCIRS